jgi:hypothetical protein
LKGKNITNKTGRGVAITRMSKALVPVEFGMKTIRTSQCEKLLQVSNPFLGCRLFLMMFLFCRYDQTDSALKNQAMQSIMSGEINDDHPLTFEEAFSQERQSFKNQG